MGKLRHSAVRKQSVQGGWGGGGLAVPCLAWSPVAPSPAAQPGLPVLVGGAPWQRGTARWVPLRPRD